MHSGRSWESTASDVLALACPCLGGLKKHLKIVFIVFYEVKMFQNARAQSTVVLKCSFSAGI